MINKSELKQEALENICEFLDEIPTNEIREHLGRMKLSDLLWLAIALEKQIRATDDMIGIIEKCE